MSKWKSESSCHDRTSLSELINMPSGPYLICSQFDQKTFEGMDISRVMSEFKNKISDTLPAGICPGVVAFFFNKDHKLEICYMHIDSSD